MLFPIAFRFLLPIIPDNPCESDAIGLTLYINWPTAMGNEPVARADTGGSVRREALVRVVQRGSPHRPGNHNAQGGGL